MVCRETEGDSLFDTSETFLLFEMFLIEYAPYHIYHYGSTLSSGIH
jgi:hypothetical protein